MHILEEVRFGHGAGYHHACSLLIVTSNGSHFIIDKLTGLQNLFLLWLFDFIYHPDIV